MTFSIKDFRADTRGNFAIIFAVIMGLLILGTSVAISLSEMVKARQSIQNAADAASLAAILEPNNDELTLENREDIARTHYLTNIDNERGGEFFNPVISVTEDNGVFTVQVSGEAKIPHFLGVLIPREFSLVRAAAKALSASQEPPHVNLFFMVDNSASMGIGQTLADQMDMLMDDDVFEETGVRACAVACHQERNGRFSTYNYYREQGVRLRLDAVRDALLGFLNEVINHPAETANTRVSISTGSERFTGPNVHQLEPNIATAINAANTFELAPFEAGGRVALDQTNISGFLGTLNAELGTIGDGSSRRSPEVYAILMTDGIENFWFQSNTENDGGAIISENSTTDPIDPNFRIQTMSPEVCTTLKDRGVNVIVMNVEYIVPEFVRDGDDIIPFRDVDDPGGTARLEAVIDLVEDVETPMQACASSPEFYFSVLDETSMQAAFDSIFTTIFNSAPRLAN